MQTWTLEDREEILAKISTQEWNGTDLYHSDDSVRADREIMLAYLPHDHFGLTHASKELCNDKQIVLVALQSENEFWTEVYGWDYASRTPHDPNNNLLYFASDELKHLCQDYPGGPILALQKAVEIEAMGRQIPHNVRLVDYLEKMTFVDTLEDSLERKSGLAVVNKKIKI